MAMRAFLALLALLLLPTPALAADPASGTVSTSSPRFEWTGASNGYAYFNVNRVLRTGGQTPRCEAPFCDKVTFELKDGGDLTIAATYEPTVFLDLDIFLPDGSLLYVDGGDDNNTTTAKLKKAKTGTYTVHVTTNGVMGTDGNYTAFAQLAVPPAPAPVVAPPVVAAPPAPAPAAKPTPAKKKKPSARAACQKKAKKIKNKRKRKAALKRCAKKKR